MPVGQTLAKKANNGIGYRSTMRFCGTFPQLRAGEEGAQADGGPCERVDTSLFAVDHANSVGDTQSGLAKRFDGLDRGSARGDDVLDEADAIAVVEGALDPVCGAVLLSPAADDHERELELQRGRGRQRDGPELRRREPDRLGLVLANGVGDRLTERAEQVRPERRTNSPSRRAASRIASASATVTARAPSAHARV
jgi:hypothetical protein